MWNQIKMFVNVSQSEQSVVITAPGMTAEMNVYYALKHMAG